MAQTGRNQTRKLKRVIIQERGCVCEIYKYTTTTMTVESIHDVMQCYYVTIVTNWDTVLMYELLIIANHQLGILAKR